MDTPSPGNSYFGHDLEAMMFAKNYGQWIFDYFEPYLGLRVAEVGAGMGNFSEFILNKDITRLYAFEPSLNMYQVLDARIGDNSRTRVFNGTFEANCSDLRGAMDSVMYINVLEHIEDDRRELELARDALKPGGHLLIFVPALSWLYSNYDQKIGHHRRYHKRTLIDKIKRAELEIVDIKYFDLAGILPWYINFVLLKRDMGKRGIQLYDRLAVPISRWMENLFTPPVGKNLIVVAKKQVPDGENNLAA